MAVIRTVIEEVPNGQQNWLYPVYLYFCLGPIIPILLKLKFIYAFQQTWWWTETTLAFMAHIQPELALFAHSLIPFITLSQ